MIEEAMIWNEPNNKSHWDPEIDPDWTLFAEMAVAAGDAIASVNPAVTRVLGGMSPIDPLFLQNLESKGVLNSIDAVAVHGFPLDWNLWQIHDWPKKIDEIRAVTHMPVWVSEVGISTFGAEEVQVWGLNRTAELLKGRAPRVHWYSLYDLPQAWGGRLLLLPALLHGAAARGRLAEAVARGIRPAHARPRSLPMVPLRGPAAR